MSSTPSQVRAPSAEPLAVNVSSAEPSAAPRRRALDAFMRLPEQPSSTLPNLPASSRIPRAVDIFKTLVPAAAHGSAVSVAPAKPVSSVGGRLARRLRAVDMLELFPTPPKPTKSQKTVPVCDRPIANLPKRARSCNRPVDLDLTLDDDTPDSNVIELTDSDEEEEKMATRRPDSKHRAPDSPQFIFNTNDLLATRQTSRNWKGGYNSNAWVLSRDEFHSDQVDQDRALPGGLDNYPSFAISAADLQSLHRYLMARHDVDSFDDYLHLLALFRNTRAIEMENACSRFAELAEISVSLETARLSVLRRLQQRRSLS